MYITSDISELLETVKKINNCICIYPLKRSVYCMCQIFVTLYTLNFDLKGYLCLLYDP